MAKISKDVTTTTDDGRTIVVARAGDEYNASQIQQLAKQHGLKPEDFQTYAPDTKAIQGGKGEKAAGGGKENKSKTPSENK